MPKRDTAPSQTWRAFLDNHVRDLVSIDFFTVPTARLRVLFVFIVLSHERRRVIHFNITEHPTVANPLLHSQIRDHRRERFTINN